eukprot:43989-Rhodomonas_salina.2
MPPTTPPTSTPEKLTFSSHASSYCSLFACACTTHPLASLTPPTVYNPSGFSHLDMRGGAGGFASPRPGGSEGANREKHEDLERETRRRKAIQEEAKGEEKKPSAAFFIDSLLLDMWPPERVVLGLLVCKFFRSTLVRAPCVILKERGREGERGEFPLESHSSPFTRFVGNVDLALSTP